MSGGEHRYAKTRKESKTCTRIRDKPFRQRICDTIFARTGSLVLKVFQPLSEGYIYVNETLRNEKWSGEMAYNSVLIHNEVNQLEYK